MSAAGSPSAYEEFLEAYTKQVRTCFAASLTFVILAWLSFLLRCYVRIKFLRTFGRDDWFMIPAVVCVSASAILAIVPSYAFLHGRWTNADTLAKSTTASTALYIWGMVFLKISLGLFFTKIYSTQRWKRCFVYLIVFLTAVAGTAYFFISTCTCGVSSILGQYTGTYCSTFQATRNLSLFWSALNAFTDVLFSVLAGFTLYPLNMSRATKWGAFALLVFATLGGMASLFRLVYLISLIRPGNVSLSMIQTVRVVYWTHIETGIGVTAACLATLRPLFACFLERINTRKQERRGGGGKGSWKTFGTASPPNSNSKGTVNINALTPDDLDDFIIDPEKSADEPTKEYMGNELVQHDSHVAPAQDSNVTVVTVRVPNTTNNNSNSNNNRTPIQSKCGPLSQSNETNKQSGYTPDDLQLM